MLYIIISRGFGKEKWFFSGSGRSESCWHQGTRDKIVTVFHTKVLGREKRIVNFG